MYLTPEDTAYMNGSANESWVDSKVAAMSERMEMIRGWGVLNSSAIYGPDELPASTAPGINMLFGKAKKKWPGVKTMAVINWPAQSVLDTVDILIFQYQFLDGQFLEPWPTRAMAESRDAFVAAGTHLLTRVSLPCPGSCLCVWLRSCCRNGSCCRAVWSPSGVLRQERVGVSLRFADTEHLPQQLCRRAAGQAAAHPLACGSEQPHRLAGLCAPATIADCAVCREFSAVLVLA